MARSRIAITAPGEYQLLKDDQPFFIKGAGVEFGSLEALVAAGGNCFRTWRVNNGQRPVLDILDEAHSLGLVVVMGLDLERERHGFDYSDPKAVAEQKAAVMADVERLKDHPALLMWGLGNELNLRATDDAVWDAVEDLAKAIKAVDPDHLVSTMLAGIEAPTVKAIKKLAPSIDLLSFQIYGAIDQLSKHLSKAEYDGPYMLTEWGPTGHWESPSTKWGRPIEPCSHEKAKDIGRRYREIILKQKHRCLGSFIFLWGQKQERTSTWYGLFLERGARTEAVDVLSEAWTGEAPMNPVPVIKQLRLEGRSAKKSVTAKADAEICAELTVDTQRSKVHFITWVIREELEPSLQSDGGDLEPLPAIVDWFAGTNATEYRFSVKEPGEYRLFCEVSDNFDGSAVANIPFFVTASSNGASTIKSTD